MLNLNLLFITPSIGRLICLAVLLGLSSSVASAQYEVTTQTTKTITASGFDARYVAASNIGQFCVVAYTCGNYGQGGLKAANGDAIPYSIPFTRDTSDSLYLYYTAFQYEVDGNDSMLQLGLDTMRLYVQHHPYATEEPGEVISAINYTGGLVGRMHRRPDHRNEILEYNWLCDAFGWNDNYLYRVATMNSMASMLYAWQIDEAANVYYNMLLLFPDHTERDSLTREHAWQEILKIRDYEKHSHYDTTAWMKDTVAWHALDIPLKKLPVPPLAVAPDRSAPTTTLQLSPNPSASLLNIEYDLVYGGKTTIEVFNQVGTRVALLADRSESAGRHTLYYDSSSLPNGTYYVRLSGPSGTMTRQLIVAH